VLRVNDFFGFMKRELVEHFYDLSFKVMVLNFAFLWIDGVLC